LIESRCACCGGGCSKNNMKQCHVVDRRFRSEIKTDRRRNQHKQCQSRFDELGEIGNDTIARRRKIRIFKRGRFHAGIGRA
jgi:hypothetical protein